MCSSGSWDSSEAYKTFEGWDEKTRGMGKSEFNLVQDIRLLLHIPHILRCVQVDHGTQMKQIKHSRHEMRKLAAWEKDIRLLLHIPHILRSVQEDHGTPMKHIKPSRDGTVRKGSQKPALVSGLLFHSAPPAYSTYFEEFSNGF
ncbi:hypothetical protein B0H13DRAFT_1903289 [Mycena leptocephala]|nr:hypothetical protein B0H13DRAFT_1903289 [Mycena leptocephala]